MKTNGDMLHGGKLKPEYCQTWADYFVKYIKAYGDRGHPDVGPHGPERGPGHPGLGILRLHRRRKSATSSRTSSGPRCRSRALRRKLMIWDHNRGLMYQRVQAAYEDQEASKYIWGTAFHWYTGDHFDNVRMVHDAFPDKHLLTPKAASAAPGLPPSAWPRI